MIAGLRVKGKTLIRHESPPLEGGEKEPGRSQQQRGEWALQLSNMSFKGAGFCVYVS